MVPPPFEERCRRQSPAPLLKKKQHRSLKGRLCSDLLLIPWCRHQGTKRFDWRIRGLPGGTCLVDPALPGGACSVEDPGLPGASRLPGASHLPEASLHGPGFGQPVRNYARFRTACPKLGPVSDSMSEIRLGFGQPVRNEARFRTSCPNLCTFSDSLSEMRPGFGQPVRNYAQFRTACPKLCPVSDSLSEIRPDLGQLVRT